MNPLTAGIAASARPPAEAPAVLPLHPTPSLLAEFLHPGPGEQPLEVGRKEASSEPFCYSEVPLVDLRLARAWTPSRGGMCGVQANAHISATYQALDMNMARYLGAPSLSSWLTFAKYAAREVGSWIRLLELVLKLPHTLAGPGASSRGLRLGGALLTVARQDGLLASLTGPLRGLLEGDRVRSTLRGLGRPTWRGSQQHALLHQAWTARGGLVEGNIDLYHRLGFAFELFLRAESQGQRGVTALQRAIAEGRLEDPRGFLRSGFALYREAHLLGALARARQVSPRRRLMLESCRRHLVFEANLLLAVQEQSLVLHRPTILAHPVLHELMGSLRPGQFQMTLAALPGAAGHHRFTLLPEGGNWADFEVRMGFRELPEALEQPTRCFSICFPGRPDEVRHYTLDAHRPGTIVDLFSRYLDGPACELLLRGRPRPIHPL